MYPVFDFITMEPIKFFDDLDEAREFIRDNKPNTWTVRVDLNPPMDIVDGMIQW